MNWRRLIRRAQRTVDLAQIAPTDQQAAATVGILSFRVVTPRAEVAILRAIFWSGVGQGFATYNL